MLSMNKLAQQSPHHRRRYLLLYDVDGDRSSGEVLFNIFVDNHVHPVVVASSEIM